MSMRQDALDHLNIAYEHENDPHEVACGNAAALVQATLYLAEQQRVANLLTLARLEAEGGGTDRFTFNTVFVSDEAGWGSQMTVSPEIRQALDLPAAPAVPTEEPTP